MRRYYLGHYIKQTDGETEYFAPPVGVVGALDLAPLPIQGQLANDRPMGLFVTTAAILPSEYTLVGEGDCREIATTGKMQSAFESLVGYRPQGERLVDLLYDILTDGSDPEGLTGPKPLMPGVDGWLPLCLGGHSLILNAKFEWGKPCSRGRNHWKKIQHLLHKEFEDLADQAQKGKLKDNQHHRRCLDFWCEKYKVDDWKEFVPAKLQKDIPGRLKHETTITDSFDRANSAVSLGSSSEGWSWTAVGGTWGITSNAAYLVSPGDSSSARAESDLSSTDHYASGTINNWFGHGPCCRFASAAATFYHVRRTSDGSTLTLFKCVGGTFTSLATPTNATATPHNLKLECNGSSITPYIAATSLGTTSDTSISGGTRTGDRAGAGGTSQTFDNFEAADLGGSAGLLYTQLERGTRGVRRGLYTKWSF